MAQEKTKAKASTDKPTKKKNTPAKVLTNKSVEKNNTVGEYGDASTIGLYYRVTTAGRKVWRYRYQLRGKTRIMTLGSYPDVSLADARAKATGARSEVLKGTDPGAAAQRENSKNRQMPTVEEFIPEYIKYHAKPDPKNPKRAYKKSWYQDQLILERWLVPSIGRLRLNEVTRQDIQDILDKCRDTGASRQPGKILAVTRMMFKIAIQRGKLELTPCSYIEEPQPEPAQKAMTEEEIKTWWTGTTAAIESHSPNIQKPIALALQLMLLTGQRPGEVAAMTRNELQLDSLIGPHWIIDGERRKKGRAKAGKTHAVALPPEAVRVIEKALALSDGEFVFQAPKGGHIRTDSATSEAMNRIFKTKPRPTPHSARHTVATELEELGFEESRIGRVLGHGSKTVTGTVYINNRINEPALKNQRTLLEAWHQQLNTIVTGEKGTDNVTSIRRERLA